LRIWCLACEWEVVASMITCLRHVQGGLGPRVPLFSPFARKGFVSHTPYEFASFLAFVEKRFSLAPLTPRDQRANDSSTASTSTRSHCCPSCCGRISAHT